MHEKIRSLRWVLAQIPIQKWRSQLEGTLFFQEAKELRLVKEKMMEIYDANADDPDSASMKLYAEFEKLFLDNQEKPLFPHIRKFFNAVAELEKSIPSSSPPSHGGENETGFPPARE